MRRYHAAHERGQSIIVIALSLTAVLGLVGLVIDGSHTYIQRRRQQNAADAAAYAGARLVAKGDATNAEIQEAINSYLEANGGDPDLSQARYVSYTAKLDTIGSYDSGDSPPANATGV